MQLSSPEQCHLWNKEPLTPEDLMPDSFEMVELISDDLHDRRMILKCKKCGQNYFYEMHEEIDWVNGHDPVYLSYIPVKTENEIQQLKDTDYSSIILFYPKILWDRLADGTETVRWVGKD